MNSPLTTTTTRAQRQQAIQERMLRNRNWLGKPPMAPEQPTIL